MAFVGPGEVVKLRSVTILRFDPRNPGNVARFFLLNSSMDLKSGDRVRFDVTRTQNHTRSYRKTQRPIVAGRLGAKVTDHVRREPDRFSLQGLLTDTPLQMPAAAQALVQWPFQSRAHDLYTQLEELADEREPVFVATSLKYYDSMVITRISCPRDANTGKAVVVDMELEEARIVSPFNMAEIVDLDSILYGSDRVVDGGSQSTEAFSGGADLASGFGVP